MNAFIKIACSAPLIGLFLAAGCGDKSNPTSPQNKAVGTWRAIHQTDTRTDTVTLTVYTKDTFLITVATGYPSTERGTYAFSGDSVFFTFTGCMADIGIPCPATTTSAKISGNAMTGEFSEDSFTLTTVTLTKQ